MNNGIDPSIAVLESDDYADVVDDTPDEQQQESNDVTDYLPDLNQSTYCDDAIVPLNVPAKPKLSDMEEIINSFKSMEAGRFVREENSDETHDAQGVPVDYTAVDGVDAGEDDTGSSNIDSAEKNSDVPRHPRITSQDFINYFRNGKGGAALLTRNYDGDGVDWGDHVLNISVNEALRTRGDAAVSVIEKELTQMISKKVWTPVDLSREETRSTGSSGQACF